MLTRTFTAHGLEIYYFNEPDVKKLFNDIHNYTPCTEVIFNYASGLEIKLSNVQGIKRGGMDESVYLKWGIDNISDIEKWENYITVISNMPMYKEYMKNYSGRKPHSVIVDFASLDCNHSYSL